MAENLVGSEIIKLAGEVKAKIAQGEHIYNLTIGDFNSKYFPIPLELENEIVQAYRDGYTTYPMSNGEAKLRDTISKYISSRLDLNYSPEEFLVSGGARPLIYATYKALVDPDDLVIFPVPSWNNNHYSHLSAAKMAMIEATAANNFMPVAEDIEPFVKDATLVALCSPLNPTGTVFSEKQLTDICELIVAENKRRGPDEKPLYLMYDQIYWQLTYGETKHFNPVSINPEIRNYTIYVDGMSKAFASTGVRVGWSFGPKKVIDKMKSILSHIGAWAPKAEQVACGNFLGNTKVVDAYLEDIKEKAHDRLNAFYAGFKQLKSEGHAVEAIPPQAAIYLTVKFDLKGLRTEDGNVLESTSDITAYLLDEAGLAIVPFYAFGTPKSSTWYRLSVGTAVSEEIPELFERLKSALNKLS